MFALLKARSRTLLIPLLIVFAAMVVFFYLANTKPVQPPVEVKEKVWLVDSMEAQFERLSPVQTLYGKVESHSMVHAAAPVSGVIARVWVKEGQTVKKGESLVSLSLADLEIPLQQAKADVADTTAQVALQKLANQANQQRLAHEKKVLELKRVKVERTLQLIKKDLASQSDLDLVKEGLVKQEYVVVGAQLAVEEAQSKAAQTSARLAKAKAALALAKLNLQRGQLVAPYDVRIAKVSVSEGSRVNAGAALVSYYGLDSLELRAKLPVTVLNKVQMAVDSQVAMEAFYQKNAQRISLPLSRLAGEASTSGLDAFFTLPSELSHARPGDLMEVNLQGEAIEQVVAIPYSALYGQDQVYIIQESRLVSQTVTVVGDVLRDGKLWALIHPEFDANTKICLTHLPNAVTGLKVAEVAK